MRADNSAHLAAAARRRAADTRARAEQALRRLAAAETPVTFDMLAREAGVSRSWLYADPTLAGAVRDLRAAHPTRSAPARPADPTVAQQQASDASLRRRLELALARNRELTAEITRLRDQLARAYGRLRDTPAAPAGPEAERGDP